MYNKELLNHENNSVLYNFVEDRFYKNSTKSNRERFLNVINIGNLRPEKEHQFLIRAFAKLPSTEFQLTIAGDGMLKEILTDLISKLMSF